MNKMTEKRPDSLAADKTAKNSIGDRRDYFLAALEANLGNISKACKAAQISRSTVYLWKRNSDFADEMEAIQEGLIDLAEGQLLELIREKNVTAIIFYLKTKGRSRGYGDRIEINSDEKDEIREIG